jgi:hypothetical protein
MQRRGGRNFVARSSLRFARTGIAGVASLALGASPWLACAGPDGPLDISMTSGTGGAADAGACDAGTTRCDGSCVDLASDPDHCGACDTVCTGGEACSQGTCALACGGGTTPCGNACVDLRDDPAHCGECDDACPSGQVCVAGACALECLGGTLLCGSKCVDPSLDPANCGGCGQACPAGQTCANGACLLVCAGGAIACSGACVDPGSDPTNCGGCAMICPASEGCVGGTCAAICSGATSSCDGACVDTNTDHANCGGCNNACGPQMTCVAGACQARVIRPNCQAILQAGESTGDGIYTIQPDSIAPPITGYCDMTTSGGGWTRCFNFTNTPLEDLSGDTWLDGCVDWSMSAWSNGELLVRLRDAGSSVLYASTGTRAGAWTHAQVTSTAPPSNQFDVSRHDDLVTLANGDKLMISGDTGSGGGCWASMGNGYVIVVYPPVPDAYRNPRLMVQPYRDEVGQSAPRNYWRGNAGWNPAMEITFVPSGFSACGPPQEGTLGTFEFYVR